MPKNKWSEQILIEEQVECNDTLKTEHVLHVCISGQQLYRDAFINGKYKDKNLLRLPFDFVVLGGVPCPRGKFYEMTYTEGGKHGVVRRALIQAVDPVTDLPLIVASLKHDHVIPADIVPHEAYIRDDIDAVNMCYCQKDENGTAFWHGGHIVDEHPYISILNTVSGDEHSFPDFKGCHAVCLEFYAGDHCREFWIEERKSYDCHPIFVCGSSNVNDPEFAERRQLDMEDMQDCLCRLLDIASDYNLEYFICLESGRKDEDGKSLVTVSKSSGCDALLSQLLKPCVTTHRPVR